VLNVHGRWDERGDDEQGIAWARAFFQASAPYASSGAYVNFMTEEESARVAAAYGANYDRLAQIKHQYDPENLFHLNQNIKPPPGQEPGKNGEQRSLTRIRGTARSRKESTLGPLKNYSTPKKTLPGLELASSFLLPKTYQLVGITHPKSENEHNNSTPNSGAGTSPCTPRCTQHLSNDFNPPEP
jgi:Berberine and berberine like